jgi:dTMP kinase
LGTPGLFIVVEGGDGAGKGSVIGSLAQTLRGAGNDVLVTREPGGTPEGTALRALLLSHAGAIWEPSAELLLMTAARIQHVARLIAPALAAGRHVLCDRFIGSTLAYQGGGRGLDDAMIQDLHRTMVGDVWPDLTLLLDVDPAIALARSHARLQADPGVDEGRFEALDLAFHQRVRHAYRALAHARANWRVIDASRPLAEVRREAAEAVLNRLETRRQSA